VNRKLDQMRRESDAKRAPFNLRVIATPAGDVI
jgi:hypothetical protein